MSTEKPPTDQPPPQRGVFLDEKAFHEFHTQSEKLRALRRELTKTRVKTVLGVIVDAVADSEPSSSPAFSFEALPAIIEGFKAKLEAAERFDHIHALLKKHGTHTADCAVIAVDEPPDDVECSCGWDEIEADFAEEDRKAEAAATAEAAEAAKQARPTGAEAAASSAEAAEDARDNPVEP